MSVHEPLILTVSQLTQAIKLQLETTFPLVWVKGEVSNLKLQSSGHLYFTIKDAFAQVSCVAFRQDLLKITLHPKIGDQILVRAELNVYPPKGGYQLIVRELTHVGKGELLLKLELLKQKLAQAGYFALERKRLLPRFPKKIGIVTSPTGAVIQDILNILSRRMSGFHIILNPVRVQGEEAVGEIVQAIGQFNSYQLVDLIVVCRGGGSFEDLMPFNSELVAKAIFESKIPIVSAVGHETDTSISDLVADVRAPTPSAAAELISEESEKLLLHLQKTKRLVSQYLQALVGRYRTQIQKLVRLPLFTSPTHILQGHYQELDEKENQIDLAIKRKLATCTQELARFKKRVEAAKPSLRIQQYRARLTSCTEQLNKRWLAMHQMRKKAFLQRQFERQIPFLVQKMVLSKKKELGKLIGHLDSLHPKNVLAKGYTICFSEKEGHVVSSVENVQIGQHIRIVFADGEAESTITTIKKHEDRTRHLLFRKSL